MSAIKVEEQSFDDPQACDNSYVDGVPQHFKHDMICILADAADGVPMVRLCKGCAHELVHNLHSLLT
jgi:hypothetical protein